MIQLRSLRKIAEEVVRHLPGYALAPHDPRRDDLGRESCRLIRGESCATRQISVTYVMQLSREFWGPVQVQGLWPRGEPVGEPERRPAITVADGDSPEAIANEIKRRFLLHFEKLVREDFEDLQAGEC